MPGERPSSMDHQEQQRLLKALRESELLREISELLASSLDLTRTLQVLVKQTAEICEVERCAVWLLHPNQPVFLPAAYHFASQHIKQRFLQTMDHIWHRSRLSLEHPTIAHLVQTNAPLYIHELHEEPEMEPLARQFSIRSVLLVALVRQGKPVGLLSLDNTGQHTTFSAAQQALARSIGQFAAVAIDNARLYEEAQQERARAERLMKRAESIHQVAMAVNSGEALPEVLSVALQHLQHHLDAHGTAIALLEKGRLTPLSTSPTHSSTAQTAHTPSPTLDSLPHCTEAITRQTPGIIRHDQLSANESAFFTGLNMKHVLIIPLLIGDKRAKAEHKTECQTRRCVGFAFINYEQELAITPEHLTIAQDIAAHCAIAIDKAHIIAEARQAATLANERANTLNAVFNAMNEGLIVFDQQGKVIVSNSTSTRFIGLTRNAKRQLTSYLQQHPAYTLSGNSIPPEAFPLTRALRGEHVRGERFMRKHGDGTEQFIEVNIVPLQNDENKQIGIVSAFHDVTEQLRAERRIRRALDTMLHAAEVVSGITNVREILYRVLAMTLSALNCERGIIQLYDENLQSFTPVVTIGFPLDEHDPAVVGLTQMTNGNSSENLYVYKQLLEGRSTLIHDAHTGQLVLAAPIIQHKHLLGVMILDRYTIHPEPAREADAPTQPFLEFSAWDMAVVEGIAQFAGLAIEQTRLQQEAEIARHNEATLRESNELKDEFLAITAHEFRTPLTVILAHDQMMSRLLQRAQEIKPELKERFNESIATIEEQTRHLTNIVNTFLEVTHLNRGQIQLTYEVFDLEDIIKEVVAQQGATSPMHEIYYKSLGDISPCLIRGDRARLLQVFTNLLQNAIKYSPLGGPITVTVKQDEQSCIEVRIADKGIGIPAEAQAHLFERFYRAPNVEGSQARGIGLGLYVVAEFLRLHEGHIRVESRGIPGEGSCFILSLPLLQEVTVAQTS